MPIVWAKIPRPSPLPPLEHGAILVPVTFEGIAGKTLYMQFDLGHPSTVLYSHKWAGLASRLGRGGSASSDPARVANLRFRLGTLPVRAAEIAVRTMTGAAIDWDGPGIEIVGTVGSDVIDGRVVALDFRTDRIAVARDRSTLAPAGAAFTPFTYAARRILMPAIVNGEAGKLFYDSGSSAFAFITNDDTWRAMARIGAVPATFPVKSWDKTLTAHVVDTAAEVRFGDVTIPIREVARIEGAGFMQDMGMRAFGISGLVGNKLFLGRRLVLDTARQEFLVQQ